MLSKAVASGIGLAREYQEHRKVNKAQESQLNNGNANADQPLKTEELDQESDEEAWELDDIQSAEPKDTKPSIQNAKNPEELLKAFNELHPPPMHPVRQANMPMPVILPQRRPKHQERGFVRAYAPILQGVGIDQPTFFDFLDGFEQAIRLHPAFHAANLAVAAAVTVVELTAGPSLTLRAAAFIMHSGLEASRRGFMVKQTNKYLDGVNESFFKPRGLYAMIMTYKPESNKSIEEIGGSNGLNESVNKRNEGAGGKFTLSSGKTRGEMAIPEAAPLIYPQFDAMPEEKKEGIMKDMGHFYENYSDHRAQARYDAQNPGSKLSAPETTFVSRYSDPNSPAVQGGISGLLTGGRKPGLRYRMRQKRGKPVEKQPRGAKKMLIQNVYYLAIVNMPSDEELAQAKAMLENK